MIRVSVRGAGFAIVDDDDFELVAAREWYAARRQHLIYAECSKPTQIMMHRLIMGEAARCMTVDHRDGDTLHNCRANLRVCSQRQNCMNARPSKSNKTGLKGVSWRHDIGRWRARIMVERKEITLGVFNSAEDAARAYDAAAIIHFGEFARLNFPMAAA